MHTHTCTPPLPPPTPHSMSEQSPRAVPGDTIPSRSTQRISFSRVDFLCLFSFRCPFCTCPAKRTQTHDPTKFEWADYAVQAWFWKLSGKQTYMQLNTVLSCSLSHHGHFIGLKTGYDAENKMLAGNKVQG